MGLFSLDQGNYDCQSIPVHEKCSWQRVATRLLAAQLQSAWCRKLKQGLVVRLNSDPKLVKRTQTTGQARPRILVICPVMPALGGNGLAMRGGTFLDAAAKVGDVDLLVVPIAPARPQDKLFAQARARRLMIVETEGRMDTWCQLINNIDDAADRLAMLKRYGLPRICGFLSTPVVREACDLVAGKSYDLTIVQRSYTGLLVEHITRMTVTGPVLVDLDDDDAALSHYLADKSAAGLAADSPDIHEFEVTAYDALVSRIAGVSDVTTMANDMAAKAVANRLGIPAPVHVTNCIDLKDPVDPVKAPALILVGTLNYRPNVEGVVWFVEQVLPRIRKDIPEASLMLAGRKPSKLISEIAHQEGISLVSDADDLSALYADSALVVVPILSGSGTRIKVLEAGAYGLPIVSTIKGADGLGLEDGIHGWFTEADSESFAIACIAALQSPAERAKRALQLRRHVQQFHDRKAVVDHVGRLITAQVSRNTEAEKAVQG